MVDKKSKKVQKAKKTEEKSGRLKVPDKKPKEEPGEVKFATSIARHVRTSPRKLRLVVDAIRGRSVDDALSILKFTSKRAAKVVEKVLSSAVANAENNCKMNPDNLYIYRVYVDKGPTMKRWIPRAMGRASSIHKRTSHITVKIAERGE